MVCQPGAQPKQPEAQEPELSIGKQRYLGNGAQAGPVEYGAPDLLPVGLKLTPMGGKAPVDGRVKPPTEHLKQPWP